MNTPKPLDALWELQASAPIDYKALHGTYPSLAEFGTRLGNTDLMDAPTASGGARILAKCEWQNPAGSIKDRVAYALMCEALSKHTRDDSVELKVLEYSGGNLAAALSHLCAGLGLQMRFVLSSSSPKSLLDMLWSRGANVDLVDKDRGFIEIIRTAIDIAKEDPSWTFLYQHRSSANLVFHRETTGAEILGQLNGQTPSAWVASIGTGGTLIGVSRALRSVFPSIRTIGVTPQELPYGSDEPPNGLPKYGGSGGMGLGIKQPFVHMDENAVEHRTVTYSNAIRGMAEFHSLTGVKIGSSAAANWLVARQIASELSPEDIVTTVFPCAGTPEEWSKALR